MRDDLDVAFLRKALEQRLAVLNAGRDSRDERTAPVELDRARMGRLSRMDAMQQQAMSQATARLAELETRRIEAALKRMDSGDYGYCLTCGDEIGEGRLRFDPSVPICVACAAEAEGRSSR